MHVLAGPKLLHQLCLHLTSEVLIDRGKVMWPLSWLELPDDPEDNIWVHSFMRGIPVVMDDFPKVISSIPLIHKSLQMNLFEFHTLPPLYLDSGIQYTYLLGGYLATSAYGTYAALLSLNSMWNLNLSCYTWQPLCPHYCLASLNYEHFICFCNKFTSLYMLCLHGTLKWLVTIVK